MAGNGAINPFLYLPIEISSRELHAKLLLTYFAVDAGFEVVIGWKRMMNKNLRHMPPGVMVFKTLTANDGAAMQEARAAGHYVAAIDEEAPGIVATKHQMRWVTEESVSASNVIFTVGDDHRTAMLRDYPAFADKFRIVGNPRWDLLRPELRGSYDREVASIRGKYAPFILINTNFVILNSLRRTAEATTKWFVKTGRLDLNKREDKIYLDEVFQQERANTDAIRALLHELPTRFPQHCFILRPHPMERAETWTAILRDTPRTAMIRDGAVVPWIMASDVLVHTNCTTGVEAFALDKAAISMQPAQVSLSDVFLANLVNYRTRTVAETLDQLARVCGGDPLEPIYPSEFATTFDRFFAGMRGPFACERIVQTLQAELGLTLSPKVERPQWQPRPGYRLETLTRKHHAQVMPDIDATAIEQILQGFNRALGAERRFQVEPCGQLLFHVHGSAKRAAYAPRVEWSDRVLRFWRNLRRTPTSAIEFSSEDLEKVSQGLSWCFVMFGK